MRTLRKIIKYLIAYFLYGTGILDLLLRKKLQGKAVVLMYHRVIPEDRQALCHSHPGIVVDEDVFERHLEVIRRYFRPLSLAEFQECMATDRPFPDRSCLVTFDDGWVDNYETAFPVLKRHHVPVTIFLPFSYISGKRVFWQEELMQGLTCLLGTGRSDDDEFVRNLVTADLSPDEEELLGFVSALKAQDNSAIDDVLHKVRARCEDRSMTENYDRYLTWEQVREMQENGVSFGSHALSHRILTKLTAEECAKELGDSKRNLETALNTSVDAIAYPNGNHDARVEQLAEQAGYALGFTTRRGYVSVGTDAYQVPRINIHNNSSSNEAMYLCTILGIFRAT